MAVLNAEQCSTGNQCKFLRTEVILLYLLVLDIIQLPQVTTVWTYPNMVLTVEWDWKPPTLTFYKNIGYKYRSIRSKKQPHPSDVPELCKATLVAILMMYRQQQKSESNHMIMFLTNSEWAERSTKDDNWESCFQPIPLSF